MLLRVLLEWAGEQHDSFHQSASAISHGCSGHLWFWSCKQQRSDFFEYFERERHGEIFREQSHRWIVWHRAAFPRCRGCRDWYVYFVEIFDFNFAWRCIEIAVEYYLHFCIGIAILQLSSITCIVSFQYHASTICATPTWQLWTDLQSSSIDLAVLALSARSQRDYASVSQCNYVPICRARASRSHQCLSRREKGCG